MRLREIFLCLPLLLVYSNLIGQTTLTEADFLGLVRQNHPDAQQADNLLLAGKSSVFAAKGAFDPKLYGNYASKTFDGKNYFSTSDAGLKMPTRFGTDLKVGYATADGAFLNPEATLPASGQAIIGISQPVLQGLLFDERRANLRQARQEQVYLSAERQNRLNDLLFQATEAYWKWAFTAAQRRISGEALAVATLRFQNIKAAWQLGERMALDTLESFIQVQDRLLLQNEVELEWQLASAKLGNFIWGNNPSTAFPLEQYSAETPIETAAAMAAFDPKNLESLTTGELMNHPALRMYEAKIAQLEIEQRLKREKRKPKLNLNYNFLGNGAQFPVLLTDNYKWGLDFSSPLLFRTERGELQLNTLKIENTQLELEQKRRELQTKLRIAFAEWLNIQAQVALAAQSLENYRQLLALENTRFELGESTLFLVNSREIKFMEAQVKLAKLQVQQKISRAALDWALGKLAL